MLWLKPFDTIPNLTKPAVRWGMCQRACVRAHPPPNTHTEARSPACTHLTAQCQGLSAAIALGVGGAVPIAGGPRVQPLFLKNSNDKTKYLSPSNGLIPLQTGLHHSTSKVNF